MNFTNEERIFINKVKNTVSSFFPRDFDYTLRENLVEAVKYYKSKGYLPSLRSDTKKERETCMSILIKLGEDIPTRVEIIKKQEEKRVESLITRSNEAFDKKIAVYERSLERAKQEKSKAAQKYTADIEAQIVKLEQQKQEALARLEIARTAEERVKVEKEKIQLQEDLQKELEERVMGKGTERKCWECGQWFPVAGGVHTKHIKACKATSKADGE